MLVRVVLIFLQELIGPSKPVVGLVATVILLGALFIGILVYQPFYTNQMNQIRAGFMLMATCSAVVSLIMTLIDTSETDGQWAGFVVLIIILFPSFIGGYVACDMAFKGTCNRKYNYFCFFFCLL